MTKPIKKHLHETLAITLPELIALLGVKEALHRKLFKHDKKFTSNAMVDAVGSCHVFNMAAQGDKNASCGTIGCIGGYMALAMRTPMRYYVDYVNRGGALDRGHSPALHPLFYPPNKFKYAAIKASDAEVAIDRFLNGEAPWGALVATKANTDQY